MRQVCHKIGAGFKRCGASIASAWNRFWTKFFSLLTSTLLLLRLWRPHLRVGVVGLDNVGKTTIIQLWKNGIAEAEARRKKKSNTAASHPLATKSSSLQHHNTFHYHRLTFTLDDWDFGFHAPVSDPLHLPSYLITHIDVLVLVIDAADTRRLDATYGAIGEYSLKHYFDRIIKEKVGKEVPILILVNVREPTITTNTTNGTSPAATTRGNSSSVTTRPSSSSITSTSTPPSPPPTNLTVSEITKRLDLPTLLAEREWYIQPISPLHVTPSVSSIATPNLSHHQQQQAQLFEGLDWLVDLVKRRRSCCGWIGCRWLSCCRWFRSCCKRPKCTYSCGCLRRKKKAV